MTIVSHDVLVPGRSVPLSPLATFRDAGSTGDAPKSAIRALQILELVAQAPTALRAVDIATTLALSPSSASELLKAMADRAYLIFDPISKLYSASPRLSRTLGAIDASYFGAGAVRRVMEKLALAFDGFVFVSAPQGRYMQVLDSAQSANPLAPKPFPTFHEVGFQAALFGSSTGAAWLSTQSDERIRTMMRLCRRELGGAVLDQDALITHFRSIRTDGHAFGGMSEDDSYRTIAVPLPPARDGIVLVLSLHGERAAMEAQRATLAAQAIGAVQSELSSVMGNAPY